MVRISHAAPLSIFCVDVVMCLKGSDDNDVHKHLVISDSVSILRFEKSG